MEDGRGRRQGTVKEQFWETGYYRKQVGPEGRTLRCQAELTPSPGLDQAADTRDDC